MTPHVTFCLIHNNLGVRGPIIFFQYPEGYLEAQAKKEEEKKKQEKDKEQDKESGKGKGKGKRKRDEGLSLKQCPLLV